MPRRRQIVRRVVPQPFTGLYVSAAKRAGHGARREGPGGGGRSGLRLAVLLVPKVESAREVELIATVLDADDGQPGVWALIETPRAIQCLPEILGSRSLAGVVFGAADYVAAGCSRCRCERVATPRVAHLLLAQQQGVIVIH